MRLVRAGVVGCLVVGAVGVALSLVCTPLPVATSLGPTQAEPGVVHVKLRRGAHLAAGVHATSLFAPVADPRDPRAAWVRVTVPAADVDAAVTRLAADPAVEEAFAAPVLSLPVAARAADDDSCPVVTPSFESYQEYLGPAPGGIDAPAAWRRGVRGGGVWFADIEGNWNARHEDLPADRIENVGGKPIADAGWRQHGTAVLGEVVGRDNDKGVLGIAPDVERVFTSSIGDIGAAQAIDAAARRLRAGDVLLIELQGGGPRRAFVPVEYWDDCYDAIRAATDRGVVVVEAAGNGAENLDHAAYAGKFDRDKRDSGAIMVGAGGPPREGFTDRARLDFSNYGGRVDVQGWGRKVATLDYGDLQRCDGATDRRYTGEFSGTSSASPMVAGAALLLESHARKGGGGPIDPAKLRALLRETGTPQAGDAVEAIGPRPDLARALP